MNKEELREIKIYFQSISYDNLSLVNYYNNTILGQEDS